MKTKLLIGAIALSTLIFTGCGSSSSSSGGTNPPPVQPAPDPTEPPLSNNGNIILLNGDIYDITLSDTYEMYVSDVGNVVFGGCGLIKVYDANFNAHGSFHAGSHEFNTGQYYVQKGGIHPKCTLSINSNVLYNPLAQ